MRVFLAWHTSVDSEREDSKLLGVYSSEAKAQTAIDPVRDKPGFRSYPDGFEVSESEVDADSWTEGFGFDDPVA